MISTRFEDVVITTFDQDYVKVKHFIIDKSTLNEKQSTAVAKRFCRQNRMRFKEIVLHIPYEVGPWQHESVYGFDAESKSGSPFYR